MTFWTTEHWRAEGANLISPFDVKQIANCSYELTLGNEGYVTGGEVGKKTNLEPKGTQIVIPPGQFALLISQESISVPANALGLISVKSSYKFRGLVSVSGFHVDPGFVGKLIFSVYNAGGMQVVISQGERAFLLWLANLESETGDPYRGSRTGQSTIPNSDIMAIGHEQFSPAAVNDRLTEVEVRVKTFQQVSVSILAVVLAAAVGLGVSQCGRSEPSEEPPTRHETPSLQQTTSPRPLTPSLPDQD